MKHTEKSHPGFSVCLIGNFSCGADFSKNGVDYLEKLAAVLKNLIDFLKNLAAVFQLRQVGASMVASVAFSVALPEGQFAPISIMKSAS